MMVIENKYSIGQIVYLTTDAEQLARVITSIQITSGDLVYEVNSGPTVSRHYEFEISKDKNIIPA